MPASTQAVRQHATFTLTQAHPLPPPAAAAHRPPPPPGPTPLAAPCNRVPGRGRAGAGGAGGGKPRVQRRDPQGPEQVQRPDHAAQEPGSQPGHALRHRPHRGGHEQAAGAGRGRAGTGRTTFRAAGPREEVCCRLVRLGAPEHALLHQVVCPLPPTLHPPTHPQVGISSMWWEGNPCNMHLNDLAAEVKAGVADAGLVGLRFNTIGVSDGISMGTDGMSFSLQSRDLIAGGWVLELGADGLQGPHCGWVLWVLGAGRCGRCGRCCGRRCTCAGLPPPPPPPPCAAPPHTPTHTPAHPQTPSKPSCLPSGTTPTCPCPAATKTCPAPSWPWPASTAPPS